jgi:hypothetical protein
VLFTDIVRTVIEGSGIFIALAAKVLRFKHYKNKQIKFADFVFLFVAICRVGITRREKQACVQKFMFAQSQ